MTPKQKIYYVLDKQEKKEILVTPETASEYRNATRYIRLRKPAPQTVEKQEVVKKAVKKAAVKKAAKKKSSSKSKE